MDAQEVGNSNLIERRSMNTLDWAPMQSEVDWWKQAMLS